MQDHDTSDLAQGAREPLREHHDESLPSDEVLKVESGDELPADQIFLETNCGGVTKPEEPNKPGCTPGTDMTLSRVAFASTARGS